MGQKLRTQTLPWAGASGNPRGRMKEDSTWQVVEEQ